MDCIDETGNQHGTWLVGHRIPNATRRKAIFACKCVKCGNDNEIAGSVLRRETPGCLVCKSAELATAPCVDCKVAPKMVRSWTCGHGCDKPIECPEKRPKAYRTRCEACYYTHRYAVDKARVARPREKSPTLETARLVKWLQPYLLDWDVEYLAKICEVDPTTLNRMVKGEYKSSKLDTVDRILCRLDAPSTLMELYPEIYEFTEEQMREAEEWASAAY